MNDEEALAWTKLVTDLRDQLDHANAANLAFNLKVAQEINQLRRDTQELAALRVKIQTTEATLARVIEERAKFAEEAMTVRNERDRLQAKLAEMGAFKVCDHPMIVMPGEPWPGDEAVKLAMRTEDTTGHVNTRWPRFAGPCPGCGKVIIHYHSRLHMYMTS